MRTILPVLSAVILLAFLGGCRGGCTGTIVCPAGPVVLPPQDTNSIATVLDRFHAAASKAHFDAYFACFANDAVFLGTDATERWTVDQFKAYCKPYFDQGKGWTYTPRDRHIALVGSPGVAHFDELLDNDKYGICRGSGVLVFQRAQWKIAQYNLSFMVPNAKAAEVTAITRAKK